MPSYDDCQYLKEAIPLLPGYLAGSQLYYPLGAHLPPLTLGTVLLSLARSGAWAAASSNPDPQALQVQEIRFSWQSAWQEKASREIRARRELWQNYLREYRRDAKAAKRLYAWNVRYRAILTLLGVTSDHTDGFLNTIFIPGGFIWEDACAINFPPEAFWYLFGTLKE